VLGRTVVDGQKITGLNGPRGDDALAIGTDAQVGLWVVFEVKGNVVFFRLGHVVDSLPRVGHRMLRARVGGHAVEFRERFAGHALFLRRQSDSHHIVLDNAIRLG